MTARALIIGWGSIGRQHADALAALGAECAAVTRRPSGIKQFDTIADAIHQFKPDYVVIAVATAGHLGAFEELASSGFSGRVLVEKPLFHENAAVPGNRFSKIGVGYQLRFHPALQALRDALKDQRVISAHCYCGQYLPEWRPGADYRQSYSASRAGGGGVLRDLSHEIDYILWLFGPLRESKVVGGKFSDLDITSEDTVGMTCVLARCPVLTMQLNYCDRRKRRELIVNTAEHTFSVDLVDSSLQRDTEPMVRFPAQGLLRSLHASMLADAPSSLCSVEEGRGVLAFIEDAAAQIDA